MTLLITFILVALVVIIIYLLGTLIKTQEDLDDALDRAENAEYTLLKLRKENK